MSILQAKNLSLAEVHHLFSFQRQYNSSFSSLLSLEPLTDYEQQELLQIQNDFSNYLIDIAILSDL